MPNKIEDIVPHTCGDIDKIIKSINEAEKSIGKAKDREDWDWLDYAATELWGLVDELEKLRKANETLREYGQKYFELRSQIEDLHFEHQDA